MSEKKRERVQLTAVQRFNLWKNLQAIEKELQAEQPAIKTVAEQMTRAMGHKITVGHIERARLDGVVSWIPKLTEKRATTAARKAALPHVVADLCARLDALDRETMGRTDSLHQRVMRLEAAVTTPCGAAPLPAIGLELPVSGGVYGP